MLINIRSIIKNFSALIYTIQSSKSPIDVVVLTEVGISDTIVNLFNIEGYILYSNLRKRRKGGGIIIYIRNKYKLQRSNTNTLHCESLIGKIKISPNHVIHICALYRPPKKSKYLFTCELKKLLTNRNIPRG